jgi:hypothetical protein
MNNKNNLYVSKLRLTEEIGFSWKTQAFAFDINKKK